MKIACARVRSVVDGVVAEQDLLPCSQAEWVAARAENPALSLWPVLLTPSGDVVAVEPLANVLGRLGLMKKVTRRGRKGDQL